MEPDTYVFDDVMKQLILAAIIAGPVSVRADEDGMEYALDLDSNTALVVSCDFAYRMNNVTYVHYEIVIGDTVIISTTIPANKTVLLEHEQDVLDVVRACSDKIIQQEIQARQRGIYANAYQKLLN